MIAVNDLYASVQGEGQLTGTPMVVLRLHGCLVRCHFCDTKQTWDRVPANQRPLDEAWRGENPLYTLVVPLVAAALCRTEAPALSWVMLTGGEPGEQEELPALVYELKRAGFKVSIETSGTGEHVIDCGATHVALSPKPNNPGQRPLIPQVVAQCDEVKWLVGKASDIDAAREFAREHRLHVGRIGLQPISQSPRATELAIAASLDYGFRVSIQTHKYLGLA